MQKLLSAKEVHEQKTIYWVKSYKTILTYMDIYFDVLKPVIKGTGSGKRYFVTDKNLKELVRKFENSELS